MKKSEALRIALKGIEGAKAKSIIKKIKLEKNYLRIGKEKIKIPERFYVFGSGKASLSFAEEFYKKYKNRIKGGTIISYKSKRIGKVKVLKGDHPIVGKNSLKSSKKLIEEMTALGKKDFFIYFLSGGSSAMLEEFEKGITLKKAKKLNEKWVKQGISIEEINERRKKISKVKGGKLADRIKANGVVLVISDVVGNKIETIGSAPLLSKRRRFKHIIIASNEDMLRTAKKEAEKLGYNAMILTDEMKGETREVAKPIISIASYLKRKSKKKLCILLSGETTVTIKGKGDGGRNQEFCLSSLIELKEKKLTVLSIGSDGIDFNEYAGAVVDWKDLEKARKKRMNLKKYLENNDSTTALKKLKCLIKTGYSGTNVMDLVVILT